MNQKTAQGQRLIDQAKTAVENFINKVRDKYNKKKTEQTHTQKYKQLIMPNITHF
jgi:hypothetical protein